MLSRYVVSQVKHNSWFLAGMALGLWVALVAVPLEEAAGGECVSRAGAAPDEFEPQREEKPPSGAPRSAARAVQRPRYYSTELGMRGSLLTAVLSSEEALKSQITALNRTAARLQPALKFFITASAMSAVPGLANVVGFTDTREMLKPFHTLKYLADNYLEEYDFFFLVSDTAFVNARRLGELVSQLSVSQDVYMGTVAEDDSHYCSLDTGIILSNSVLRAVHSELDWCVRNSYSPHHHENIGRCVLHAARLSCMSELQGEVYRSARARAEGAPPLREELADALTVAPVLRADVFYQLHAYVSRVHLQRDRGGVVRLRAALWRGAARHPPQYRNASWPAGLRADPGLATPPPDNRFDYVRWISFNGTHAFMPDDHREVALITGADRAALDLVLESVYAWAAKRWSGARATVVEGAWRWLPASELRYRVVVRLAGGGSRLVEVVRPLGAARLVPVRYVTESARVSLLLTVPADTGHVADAGRFLRRYETVAFEHDKNVALYVAIVGDTNATLSVTASLRAAVEQLAARRGPGAARLLDVPSAPPGAAPQYERALDASRAALQAALPQLPPDALLLLLPPHADFNQDFLNRVRMNTISGWQWYLPSAFSRYAVYPHERFVAPGGGKPQTNTGRFNRAARLALSVYRTDYEAAAAKWKGADTAAPADVLAACSLRCLRAPEPALVLEPRGAPCGGDGAAPQPCARSEPQLDVLDLGARHSLAQLLLEVQAERDG